MKNIPRRTTGTRENFTSHFCFIQSHTFHFEMHDLHPKLKITFNKTIEIHPFDEYSSLELINLGLDRR